MANSWSILYYFDGQDCRVWFLLLLDLANAFMFLVAIGRVWISQYRSMLDLNTVCKSSKGINFY